MADTTCTNNIPNSDSNRSCTSLGTVKIDLWKSYKITHMAWKTHPDTWKVVSALLGLIGLKSAALWVIWSRSGPGYA